MTLLQAIARMEGFGASPLNRPTRNNNPGDLEYEAWEAQQFNAVRETVPAGKTARFAKFSTVDAGFAAMRILLQKHYAGKTVAQVITAYAPPIENPTETYIRDVCQWVGCKPDDVIDALVEA